MNIDDIEKSVKERFPAIYKDLEDSNKLSDENKKWLNFELYKMLDRQTIINLLSSKGVEFIDCKEYMTPNELDFIMSRLISYNMFVSYINKESRNLVLCTNYFETDNDVIVGRERILIELRARGYNVTVKYLTPLNYKDLTKGKSFRNNLYDTMILYKRIIYDALEKQASDVHISSNLTQDGPEFTLYYRLLNDYVKQDFIEFNKQLTDNLILELVKTYAVEQASDLQQSTGVKASLLNPLYDGSCDLRITCSKTNVSTVCVTRISKMSSIGRSIENLGFNSRIQNVLHELATHEEGLTLITGAQRTGKNTTMMAIVNEIFKTKKLKLKEFSSPIETILPCEQVDFRNSVDALMDYIDLTLKQDVDIALISELPSKKVAKPISDLINSSVGVFTTFHINRVYHVFYKMKSYFGDDYIDLITQLNGVVNQKMFVKQCAYCAKLSSHRNFPSKVLKYMDKFNITTFAESDGKIKNEVCPYCKGTGKSNSLQPFAEYILFDDDLKSELLNCSDVRFMEPILRDYCEKNKSSLDYFIKDGITASILNPNDFLKL